ncbi:FO synthase [Williamsia soli]|uniref:FO synthase n=1 Tax=Williamsia soli TaxID=364929 RepID=UPI001A9EFF84|nr:FO synthase [Williamsia soli]
MTLRSSWAEDSRLPGDQVAPVLRSLLADPSSLDDGQWATLLGAQGAELDELCAVADSARRDVVGDELTFVANRNLETGAVVGSAAAASLEDLVAEAWTLGATEICMQGPVPQSEPADAYLELVRRIRATAPDLHVHAYRVPEVRDAAERLGVTPREFLEAARDVGVGTVPGTAAQVLDDEVREVLSPGGLSVAEWVETITTAHDVGLRSTATMLYGHVEQPAQQIAHLRLLVDIQRRTGGFTELILMPLLPENAPPHLRAQAVRGPSLDETRALHAVARLLTVGAIDHLQAAWTKLDDVALEAVLRGGADDVGGVLIDGSLRPDAGPESGRQLVPAHVGELAAALGRTTRQRTTLYETAPDERQTVLQKVFA